VVGISLRGLADMVIELILQIFLGVFHPYELMHRDLEFTATDGAFRNAGNIAQPCCHDKSTLRHMAIVAYGEEVQLF
jgi:hypothetical protein